MALAAVVVYHAGPPGPAKGVLLSCAIGLFFVISGFLYKDAYSSTPIRYILRRLRRLWVPYVAWGLFFLALHNLFLDIGFYSELAGFQGHPNTYYGVADFSGVAIRIVEFRHTEQMGGALWFLPLLFCAEAAFVLLGWAAGKVPGHYKESLRFTGVLLLSAVGYLEWPRALPAVGSSALVAVLPLYMGFLLRQVEARVQWRWYWAAACGGVMLWLGPAVDFGANRYAGPMQLVLATACGAYAAFYLARRFGSSRQVASIGRDTIFIVATHFLAFKLVSMAIVQLYGLPRSQLALVAIPMNSWWIAYSAVGLLVPWAVKSVFDRALAMATSTVNGSRIQS
jgi:fucose 4-O-acetylase-like acetyltransferase